MTLREKIQQRTAQVSVVGLGYVGLPLAVAFARAGFKVVGVDTDVNKVRSLNAGRSYVSDISEAALAPLTRGGDGVPAKLRATTEFDALSHADAIIVCVPTPMTKDKEPEMSHILAATDQIARHLHRDQLIVLESTTYPGTTQEILLPRFASPGFEAGKDFYLAFSPERIDPGRKDYTLENTPKVMGGVTPQCLEMAVALYGCAIQRVVPVSSTATAEMVKLLENTFRAINIGLVNEVAIMCEHLGLDVWEVIEAASTKPFGFVPFQPGPGLGGHCIPIDPHLLAWKLKTLNYNPRFIEVAGEINFGMPHHVVKRAEELIREGGKSLAAAHVMVVGVAYKRDVGDLRESPALDVLDLLCREAREVSYNDPLVPQLEVNGRRLKSAALTPENLAVPDCVVVATDHTQYDWPFIFAHSRRLLDTRNVSRFVKPTPPHVARLGARPPRAKVPG